MRGAFGYDRDAASDQAALDLRGKYPTIVQQAFKADSDINNIVRRFGLTGQMPPPREGGQYGDFSEVTDFQTAMNALLEAQENFEQLPATLRDRFQNDPGRFLEFVQNDDNYEEAQRLGLVPPKVIEAPPGVVVEPPADDS